LGHLRLVPMLARRPQLAPQLPPLALEPQLALQPAQRWEQRPEPWSGPRRACLHRRRESASW